jgi:CheY-like chemotaxis protein
VTQSSGYVVLIVEDSPDHVALIKIVFEHFDKSAHITTTHSAEEAITHIAGPWPDSDFGRDDYPDVIVLDINMEGIGGLGFLKWYSEQPNLRHLPVVVFTSSGDPDLERECRALGAHDFKQKPNDFSELVPVVQRALAQWQAKDQQQPGVG